MGLPSSSYRPRFRVTQARAEWLGELEGVTHDARHDLAAAHWKKAIEALVGCDCKPLAFDAGGQPTEYLSELTGEISSKRIGGRVLCCHRSTEAWHLAREKGQRHRFERVSECGTRTQLFSCKACKKPWRQSPVHCDAHRACIACRGRRARRLRARFTHARKALFAKFAKARQGHAPGTTRRRWREVFLTLTYPDSGNVAADVARMYEAWPAFIRRVRAYVERRLGVSPKIARALPFLRVLEITPGRSEQGHAHIHVWMLAPFISHVLLRSWWGRSLDPDAQSRLPAQPLEPLLDGLTIKQALKLERKGELDRDRVAVLDAGRTRYDGRQIAPAIAWPVLDIRAVKKDPSNELIKYMLKDVCDGALVDSNVFGNIFLALEGRRGCVVANGFWVDAPACTCAFCGAVGSVKVELMPSDGELAALRMAAASRAESARTLAA